MSSLSVDWLEALLTAAAVAVLFFYHLYLIIEVRRFPLRTVIGLNNRARRAWVERVVEEQRDILAVQSLRNWIMAASFFASTAVLLNLGLVNIAVNISAGDNLFVSALMGSGGKEWWLMKIMVLVVDFFAAFLNFSLAIRSFIHVNFMVNVRALTTSEYIAKALNQGALHYTLGMRGFYFAIPLTLWLFSPIWMLLGSLVLVAVLHRLDHLSPSFLITSELEAR
jgi:uncharacterized membrane protein